MYIFISSFIVVMLFIISVKFYIERRSVVGGLVAAS
jgi:hypothetical protein